MINNMDGLYRVIQKGDVILVEGDSHISRMIKLFTQSSWSHSALYVGDEILVEGADHREAVINRFGKDDAHHMVVEAFTGTGVCRRLSTFDVFAIEVRASCVHHQRCR